MMQIIISICLFVVLVITSVSTYSDEIYILKTRSVPNVSKVVEGFIKNCDTPTTIQVMDMRGDERRAMSLLKKIKRDQDKEGEKYKILTLGAPATKLTKRLLKDNTVVYAMVYNPLQRLGLKENLSGVSLDISYETQLSHLLKVIPGIKKVGVLYNDAQVGNLVESLEISVASLGLQLERELVTSPKEVPSGLRRLLTRVDSLVLLPDTTVLNRSSLPYIVTTTLSNRIPTVAYTEVLVKSGVLMAAVPGYEEMGHQAASILCTDSISSEKSIPMTLSPEFDTAIINLKTAKRLNLVIEEELLNQFKHVN